MPVMKIIITGTVGLDKGPYLEKVAQMARENGKDLTICHVGRRMYAEAPDITPGRILDLPLSRLRTLRRSVFKDILALAEETENLIINTHATFRWKHGLFPAFDFDQVALLQADMYICLIDNVDALHARLLHEHQIDHSLKDLLVWREEETLATEMMMLGCTWQSCRIQPPTHTLFEGATNSPRFYLLARGQNPTTEETLYRLMFRPEIAKTYLSFPMSHVTDMPEILAEIAAFRKTLAEHFIVFDPSDLEEQQLYVDALSASEQGQKVMEVQVLGETLRFDVAEIMQVAGDIHGQIYARDFMLIDQADMIISYIPQMPGGKPGLSSGVERELQHAHEAAKEVYIVWKSKAEPSPFVSETATRIFSSTEEAITYFKTNLYQNSERRSL
ncbi:MAG: adenylate kinase [Planctomycetes bacterium ADurb.Bin412]|nr:MAG: adenylate kinase [Planctomycetes bacterium ADurb.Bin412]